tara:strand:- start:113 stop:298 length:186 start_codon:yes stop_codon:yes gene_type:complete
LSNHLIKEVSDEADSLRKQLISYKSKIKNNKLDNESSLSHIENMIRSISIVYAKLNYLNKL